jgi:hypothetical protein
MSVVNTTGLDMPNDFAVGPYEEIHNYLKQKRSIHEIAWDEYAAAWNAISYRFYSLSECDIAYTKYQNNSGNTPPPLERYLQERELFSFFINGLSTIESLCYGMYAIGSIIEPTSFIMQGEENFRNINANKVCEQFMRKYPLDDFTNHLNTLLRSTEYENWKQIRNILAHRSAPGRNIHVTLGGENSEKATVWKIMTPQEITLDAATTSERRIWISNNLKMLLESAFQFVQEYIR